ncbi:hypothetical protein [Natrarchaeobius chitinivorans]|uniref:DUF8163 domain-containing protein n=1 Tax=Natrarchaeobius chitinivorans TaxID=1679083 RepID=A0A3N6M6P6_NATCH|nr:hypothetical protein [Natrarchaeobius chitinivorans]RQG90981.1 hypothetical protein EA473_19550 [Natrarchaeobius chitinivorans]
MNADTESGGAITSTDRTALEALALLVTLATLWLTVGSIGVAIGLATAVVWYAFGPPYGLAVGFVGLAGAFPTVGFGFEPVRVPIVAFAITLLAAGVRTATPLRFGLAAVTTVSGLAAIGWLALASTGGSILLAGLVTGAVAATLSYLVHRYERLSVNPPSADRSSETVYDESVPVDRRTSRDRPAIGHSRPYETPDGDER